MSQQQSTALVLLFITAFLFWLYNTKKLGTIVSVIKGTSNTNVNTNSTLPVIPVGNGSTLQLQPLQSNYQLPAINNGPAVIGTTPINPDNKQVDNVDKYLTGIDSLLTGLGWL
jgi:hypothetical protein